MHKNPFPSEHFETSAIRTQAQRSGHREHSAPIYMTSSYLFDDAEDARAVFANEREGLIYSRYDNPSNDEFVDKMLLLEGAADGLATATGMAAIFGTLAGSLSAGDHLLAGRSLFGSTYQLLAVILPRFGITTTFFDIDKPETWDALVTPATKLVYVETPTNPGLDLVDLSLLSALCKRKNLVLAVDNAFATPYLQNPLKQGADLVVHSATKYIDGQGRGLGGVILGSAALIEKIRFFVRQTGPALSPFHGWMFSKSLETLPVRMERHCDNAEFLAKALLGHPALKAVNYPFLPSHRHYELAKRQMKRGGGMITIELSGVEAAKRFLDKLEMLSLTANLGDTRTTVTHPASTTHSKMTEPERQAVGITQGLVRISVGLEHRDDVLRDITTALRD
ncbi:MAG: PLP-dependent transferase [Spirochaetales bacterium]